MNIENIVSKISYLDWIIKVRYDDNRPYLQVYGHGSSPKGNSEEKWSGRKWWLSPHMCENEIVNTAYKAIEAAVLHEMREHFKFRNVAIFNPHLDYTQLAYFIINKEPFDTRSDGLYGV